MHRVSGLFGIQKPFSGALAPKNLTLQLGTRTWCHEPHWAVHTDFGQFQQSANYTIKTGFLRETDKTSIVYVLFWV